MEEPCWELADRRVAWVIFRKIQSQWEISALPVSLHKDESITLTYCYGKWAGHRPRPTSTAREQYLRVL